MRELLVAIALITSLCSTAIAGPKPEGIRTYFEQAFLRIKPPGANLGDHPVMVLSDTVVVVTGLDTITGVRDGAPFSSNGRVTFVVAKRGSDWQIVHFHRSAMPN